MSAAEPAPQAREPSARYVDALQPPLVRQFGLLATAPGGVARLRELILTLAVQGKLVPQEPSDEPAVELLRKIEAEKSRLASSGQLQRQKLSPEVQEEDEPFELPIGWAWVRLPQISYGHGQGAPAEAFTYIDVAAIDNMRAVITEAVQVVQPADAPSRARKRVSVGTVIYSTVRPYLKNIAIVEKAYVPGPIVSTAFAVMHPHTGVNAKYLLHYLRSAVFTEFVASKMAGIAYPAINDSSFFKGIVALPPTAEQARIVARVDELMRLCDALEAQGRLEAEQHSRLLGTLLGTLTDSSTPEELAANWQRVAAHFDLLLDRPEAVDALEQTILQLAVRGLLVPQDPSEKPASALLDAIHEEKSKWITDRKGKRDTSKSRVDRLPVPFQAPPGWSWVGLDQIALQITDGTHHTPKYQSSGTAFISVKDVDGSTVSFADCKFISEEEHQKINARCNPERGDMLLCRIGTLGRPTLVDTDRPFSLFVSVGLLKLPKSQDIGSHLHLVLSSPLLADQYQAIKAGGSHTRKLNLGDIPRLQIPLPPLAEQARILDRVTELRRLCAALRQRLAASQSTQSHLAEALVEQAAA